MLVRTLARRGVAAMPAARRFATTYFTDDHEWVSVDGGVATIGITEHAQEALGDIVYVELPDTGASFKSGDAFGSVESVKTSSECFLPCDGEVVEINEVRRRRCLSLRLAPSRSPLRCSHTLRTPASPTHDLPQQALEDAPETVNESAEGDGWFIKVALSDESQLEALLDAAAYKELCDNE